MCFFKRFRSLNAENLGSVGQRVAKLPVTKFENDLTPGDRERGPLGSSVAGAERQTFSSDLQL